MKTVERASLEDPEPNDEKKSRHGILGFMGEVPGLVLMAFVLALIIRTFLFQAFFIPSPSMEPTLIQGDRVLVNKIPFYFHDPRRGDIIVFNPPTTSDKPYIKRVLATAGDHVAIHDGSVWINGKELAEPYIKKGITTCQSVCTWDVPDGDIFVLGDNRTNSSDSRVFGVVKVSSVIGKAWLTYWPLSDFGLVPHEDYGG